MNKHYIISIFLFLTLVFSVSAVTISNVNVSDLDTFYSSVGGNDVVNLRVDISNINGTVNDVLVTADFSGLDVDCDSGAIITLNNIGGNTWAGICDVGDEAMNLAANTFNTKPVWIKANETNGPSDAYGNFTISLYNINFGSSTSYQSIKSSTNKPCYRFGVGSTNLNEVLNFNNINDITLIIEAGPDSSCTSEGLIPGYSLSDWLPVAKLKFNSITFNNNAIDAQKLRNLFDVIKFKFSSANTYQNTKVTVDTTKLPELDVNPFNVELYHLSLTAPRDSFIVSDNSVQPSLIEWTSNGLDGALNTNTYNVKFAVDRGFKGFTITDNIAPTITLHSPSSNHVFNSSNILINATVNGTGTGVSRVLFYVNGVSNTANCTVVTPEVSNCILSLTKADGSYNLSVVAYDYGLSSGNNATTTSSFIVQTSAPLLSVKSPVNNEKYTATAGSMLKLNFSTSDGNGISSCGYKLDGPVDLDATLQNCTNVVVQLYLENGDYNLYVFSKDALNAVNSTNISFEVDDTKAPIVTNNTKLSTKNNMTLSVLTDEKATCKYDDDDVAYDRMNKEFDDNILTHVDGITLSAPDKIFNYYIRCSDLSGNVNKESLKLSLYYGDVTNVTTTVVQNVTKQDPYELLELKLLSAGKNTMMFDKASNPIELITLVTKDAVNDVSLKIISVSTPSHTYSEKVYKYVSIEHIALRDSNIDAANITFKVGKSWLTTNNIDKNDIVLLRYSDNWTKLTTTLAREDGENIYYTANSPGLSLFAISYTPKPVVTAVVPVTNTTNNNTSAATELLSKRPHNWFWIITLSIIVFIIIVLFILVYRNDKVNPPIFAEDRTIIGRIKRLFK